MDNNPTQASDSKAASVPANEWHYSDITETLHYGPGGWRNDIRTDQRLADHLNATGYVPDGTCKVCGGLYWQHSPEKHRAAREAAGPAPTAEASRG